MWKHMQESWEEEKWGGFTTRCGSEGKALGVFFVLWEAVVREKKKREKKEEAFLWL